MLLTFFPGSPIKQLVPRLDMTKTIPKCKVTGPISVIHSIETGCFVCPHISKGKLLAALADSLVEIIPIPIESAKALSRALISAPVSIKAKNSVS